MNYHEKSDHLGHIVCQDISITAKENVQHRLTKTSRSAFQIMNKSVTKGVTGLNIKTSTKLYTTYLRPSMVAGLNALVLDDECLKMLQEYEDAFIRGIMKSLRSNSSTKPLHLLLGLEPITSVLHKSCFSLFHNIWTHKGNPTHNLCKNILLNNNLKGKYWIKMIEGLCEVYEIPPPLTLWDLDPPTKQEWKKFINQKVETYHQKQLHNKVNSMGSIKYLIPEDFTLKKLPPIVSNCFTPRQVAATINACRHLCNDYPNKVNTQLHDLVPQKMEAVGE